jgi:hypothetical protein
MLDFSDYKVPEHTQIALSDYIERGIPVGGFLNAVLANDLAGAVGRADAANLHALKDIVNWVYNHAPQNCHGNEALYRRWLHEHPARAKDPFEVV